jgi:hypothetical protein
MYEEKDRGQGLNTDLIISSCPTRYFSHFFFETLLI